MPTFPSRFYTTQSTRSSIKTTIPNSSLTMIAIKNILLFVSATTALIIPKRDTSTILSDIYTIDTNVKALISTVCIFSSLFSPV